MNRIVNFYIVFKVVSRNLLIVAGALLVCSLIAVIYREAMLPFVFSAMIALIAGVAIHFLTRKGEREDTLTNKDAYLTVTLSWLTISIIGSLPYLFSVAIPAFTNAFFESVSGFTTTGSSILTDIESGKKLKTIHQSRIY